MKVKYLLPLAVLSVGALASCGGAAEEDGRLMIWAAAQEKAVVQYVLDGYNAKAADADKINYRILEVEEPDTAAAFSKDPTAKNRPDLFLTVDDKLLGLKNQNLIVEVKGDWKTKIVNENTPVSVSNASVGDALMGFPISADNGYFLWYDKTQISAEEVKSLNSILEVCETKGKKFYLDLSNGFYSPTFLSSPDVMGTDSIKMQIENGQLSYNATWDEAEGVKAAKAVNALLQPAFNDGKGFLLNGTDDQINTLMGNDNHDLIAAVGGIWKEGPLKEKLGENLGATKLPTFSYDGEEHQMASFAGSKVYAINSGSSREKKQDAVKAAELLISKEAQLKRFELRNINPCNKEAAADPAYAEHKTIGGEAFKAQEPFSIPQGASVQDRWWGVGEAVGKALLDGKLGVDAQKNPYTWETFLTAKMDILRTKKPM